MIVFAMIYFVIAALACSLIAYGRIGGWTKAVVLVIAPMLAFAIWQAAQPPTGWPANTKPPKDAQFQWAVVHEPDSIDLWLTPAGSTRERAYRVPYSRQLHEQAELALKAVKGGVRVGIRKVVKRGHAYSNRYTLYMLPPPAAESKD